VGGQSEPQVERAIIFLEILWEGESMQLRQLIVFAIFAVANFCCVADADSLILVINGKEVQLEGEVLIEAQDKSLYFREVDGKIWFVEPQQIKARIDTEKPSPPLSFKAVGKRLLKELPAGFRIYETKHYVIAYQNEVAFARWISGLYESRLYRAFETFWEKKKKIKLSDPAYPLIAIVFGSKAQYQQYVDRELGPGQTMEAYYNLQTNRIALYDVTAAQRNPSQPLTSRNIERVLQNPNSIFLVATIIHEATHQLMFNRGLQTRFAESPLWMNEGIAMYFEAPDLRSKTGWRVPGKVFELRLNRFRRYLASRPADSLRTLLATDNRLRDPDSATDAYAESWAFNHYLFNKKSDQYVDYIKFMSKKKALESDTPETRIADFERFFGEGLAELDRQFVAYVSELR
jgi:hypothetical protein